MKFLHCLIRISLIASAVIADFCKRDLLRGYFLESLLVPDQRKVPLCPSIKNNCCSELDIKNVLDKFLSYLRPKREDFKVKFKSALWNLGLLHANVFRIEKRDNWSGNQRRFCRSKFDTFSRFPFAEMMRELTHGFETVYSENEKMHQSFLCVLCDYDAHQSMLTDINQMAVNSDICLDQLNKNRPLLEAQNIMLVKYFKAMQDFLDCSLFDGKFNFPLVFSTEQSMGDDFATCFEKLTPDTLDKACLPLCSNINVGAISPVFEGNHFFINRATQYYRNVIELIDYRNNNTAFNPLQQLAPINSNRSKIAFFSLPNIRQQRYRFMSPEKNQFWVGDNNQDDIFRNDEREYTGRDQVDEEEAKQQALAAQMASQLDALPPAPKDDPPKPAAPAPAPAAPAPKRGGLFGGFRLPSLSLPKIDLAGIAGSISNAASSAVSAVSGAASSLGAAASSAASAVAGAASKIDVGKVMSTVKSVAGAAKGAAGMFNKLMDGPLGGIATMAAGMVPGGAAILQVAKTASKVAAALPVRKLIVNADKSVTLILPNWDIELYQEGTTTEDGLQNVNGALFHNGRKLDLVEIGDSAYQMEQQILQPETTQTAPIQEAIPKPQKKAHKASKPNRKLHSNRHSSGVKIASKEHSNKHQKKDPKRHLSPVKSNRRTKEKAHENKALNEHQLIEKVTEIIDSNFKKVEANLKHKRHSKKNHKNKKHKKRALRHKRILEDLFSDEPEEFSQPSGPVTLDAGRTLAASAPATNINDLIITNPVQYYLTYYESIESRLDPYSEEIYPPNDDTIDVVNFNATFINGGGVDLNSYVPSIRFEYTKKELALILKGRANLDEFDYQMTELLKHLDMMFIAKAMSLSSSNFVIPVAPAYQSEDDKEVLKLEPVYSDDEELSKIESKYYSSDFDVMSYRSMPNPFVETKRIPRKLQMKASAEEKLRERNRALGSVFRIF